MGYLLDTNVVSASRKNNDKGDSVRRWLASIDDRMLHLSVITLGEIRRGVELMRRKDVTQAAAIERWLLALRTNYADRIIDIDETIADTWGSLGVPNPMPVSDGLIAATALTRGWTVATRNIADFEPSGVAVVNPFELQN